MKPGKYRHFKGGAYEVIGIARHSETLEEVVVYCAPYPHKIYGDNSLWIRPKDMFLEKIIWKGKEVSRFEYIPEISS